MPWTLVHWYSSTMKVVVVLLALCLVSIAKCDDYDDARKNVIETGVTDSVIGNSGPMNFVMQGCNNMFIGNYAGSVFAGTGNTLKNTKFAVILADQDLVLDGPLFDYTLVQRNVQVYGSFETSSIKFIDGEYTVQMGDHILFVGFKTLVHLGNSSNTPDGMRIIIRPNMDTDGDIVNSAHILDPKLSCERSGCSIYLDDETVSFPNKGNDLVEIGCMGKMEFVFHAPRNSWYEL